MDDGQIIDAVLKHEGGFVNNPADHGGATNFGITAADLGRWRALGRSATVDEVRGMTVDEARLIYQAWYINAPGLKAISDGYLRWVVVDSGVLHGTRTAIKWLQQALGVTIDGVMGSQTQTALAGAEPPHVAARVLAIRICRYGSIVVGELSQLQFLAGWLNRATSILAAA
jgi:lysozyme family protein